MNRYAILGCADTLVAMILEILTAAHDEPVTVDIVKNMVLDGERRPYQTGGIVTRELYAEDWQERTKEQRLSWGWSNQHQSGSYWNTFTTAFFCPRRRFCHAHSPGYIHCINSRD